MESLRAALAMEARDAFEIAFGDFAGEFLGERGDVFSGRSGGFCAADGIAVATEKSGDDGWDADAMRSCVLRRKGHSSGDWGKKNGARLRVGIARTWGAAVPYSIRAG